jgi:hypothetical protein
MRPPALALKRTNGALFAAAHSLPGPTTTTTQGFLFAFLHYSRLEQPSWVQRVVRFMVRDDLIHVAMLPVPYAEVELHDDAPLVHASQVRAVHHLRTGPLAYTAFIGAGASEQEAEHVLTSLYDFIFLPVPSLEHYHAGVAFLQHLKGAHYNYTSLPLAILPRSWKQAHMPNWITHEHPPFDALLLEEEPAAAKHGAHDDYPAAHVKIFCSQMGLLLCYASHAMSHHAMDPASCLPAELAHLLCSEAAAVPVPSALLDAGLLTFEKDRALW